VPPEDWRELHEQSLIKSQGKLEVRRMVEMVLEAQQLEAAAR
jgi:hypothetical protein